MSKNLGNFRFSRKIATGFSLLLGSSSYFPNSEVCRVLVGVKDKVSPPRLPGNVRFGRRVVANAGTASVSVVVLALPFQRCESSVTISALRV